MSKVPEPRDAAKPGTVGALLRFIDQYSIPDDAELRGMHSDGYEIDLSVLEFRVTDTGGAKLVIDR